MKRANCTGFTIIETLLVIVLLAVILSVTAVNFSKTTLTHRLKVNTDDLVVLMRYAQSQAIADAKSVYMKYDAEKRRFWLEAFDDKDKDVKPLVGRLAKGVSVLDQFELIIDNDEVINFDTDGRIDKVNIALCNKNKCRIVTTSLQRGFIHVLERTK